MNPPITHGRPTSLAALYQIPIPLMTPPTQPQTNPPVRLLLRASSLSVTLLCLGFFSSPSRAQSHPDPFQSRLIFPAQAMHVHSSSIVELPNGDLLAVWFHGSGERSANDVVIQGARLAHGALAWGDVFVAADTPNLPDCNPVLFLDARQRLWLTWIVVQANRWEQSLLKYRFSTDYENTGPPSWQWQDVILLRPGDQFPEQLRQGFHALHYSQRMWAEYAKPYDRALVEAAADPLKRDIGWMTRARPLIVSYEPHKGRLLLPLYSDGFNISLIAISDDDGARWRPSQPLVGLGNIQPSLAQRLDGTLVAFFRDAGPAPGRVMVSESIDGGESWSLAQDTDLPNPGSSIALLNLADGRWLIVLNDTENGRHQLAVMISTDEGRTWQNPTYLEKALPGNARFGYPTAIQSRNGRVHVTYTHSVSDGNTIKHVDFDPSWPGAYSERPGK
jgi:predicted neuraminidase